MVGCSNFVSCIPLYANSNDAATHTHTTVLLLFWNMSGTTRVSRYQEGKTRKVKTNLDLLEQEIVSDHGICWAICCKNHLFYLTYAVSFIGSFL